MRAAGAVASTTKIRIRFLVGVRDTPEPVDREEQKGYSDGGQHHEDADSRRDTLGAEVCSRLLGALCAPDPFVVEPSMIAERQRSPAPAFRMPGQRARASHTLR